MPSLQTLESTKTAGPTWAPGTVLKFKRGGTVVEFLRDGYSPITFHGRVLKDGRNHGSEVRRESSDWDRYSFDLYPIQPIVRADLLNWLERHYGEHFSLGEINVNTLLVAASLEFTIDSEDFDLPDLVRDFCQDIHEANRHVICECLSLT